MTETHTVTYRGSAPFASMLAQMLEQEGLEVAWDRPEESRGMVDMAEGYAVAMAVHGSIVSIRAAVAKFRKRVPKAEVEVKPGSDQPDDGGGADSRRERQADERDAAADERESVLRAREVRAQAWESADADRREATREILDSAEVRDEQAEARDATAGERDSAAGLRSFLQDDEGEYDAALKARRAAARDRSDAHTDRDSSAVDRSKLSERSTEREDD